MDLIDNDLYDVPRLRAYLVGDTYEGPGLLWRVRTRVEELAIDDVPHAPSGSIIGGKQASHDLASDNGQIETVFELAVMLVEWLGRGIGSSATPSRQALLAYLRRNRITDIDFLLGSDVIARQEGVRRSRSGKLAQVEREVEQLLQPEAPPLATLHRCRTLGRSLRDWIGICDHTFVELTDTAGNSYGFKCACGAEYREDDKGRWVALR